MDQEYTLKHGCGSYKLFAMVLMVPEACHIPIVVRRDQAKYVVNLVEKHIDLIILTYGVGYLPSTP